MSQSLASVGPYIVILIVVVVFFALCVLLFRKKPKKTKGRTLRTEVANERAYYKPQDRRDYRTSSPAVGKQSALGVDGHEIKAPQATPVAVGRGSTASGARGLDSQSMSEGKGLYADTFSPGESGQQVAAEARGITRDGGETSTTSPRQGAGLAYDGGAAAVNGAESVKGVATANGIAPVNGVAEANGTVASSGATATVDAATGLGVNATGLGDSARGLGVRAVGETPSPEGASLGTVSEGLSPSYIDHVTAQCAQRYPFLSRESKKQLRDVVDGAFKRLALSSVGQTQALLENVIVQEALYRMQEAYLATPTKWMYDMAIDAFADVVQRPKSSPIYLLAIDALKLLSQLSLGHYQAISVALLLQSTWNSNNVTKSQWARYMEKYIMPFTEALPRDAAMYKQLHYVRCFEESGDHVPLYALLARMYPYVFAYDGFTKEELNRVLAHEHMDGNCVVSSINSNLLKFAVINDEYMPLVFEKNNIVDESVRNGLLNLAVSRPSRLNGNDLRNLLCELSPLVSGLMSVYDNSPLCESRLTSLGLYIGHLHVKAVINQDFDISDWI